MTRILALDLGLATGWADIRDGKVVDSGVWHLPEDHGQAAEDLHCGVTEQIKFSRARFVAYEHVPAQAHTGGDAAHVWGMWYGIVMLSCQKERVRYLAVRPAEWKARAGLRSGSGPQDALAAAVSAGHDIGPFADEAVAVWVGLTAWDRVSAVARSGSGR